MEQILRVVIFAIMLAFAFMFVDMAQIAALSLTFAFFISAIVIVVIYLKTKRLPRSGQNISDGNSQYKTVLRSAAPITGVRLVTALTIPVISIIIVQRLVASGWDNSAALSAFGILVGMSLPVLSIPQTVISSLATALVPELSASENISNKISSALKFTLFTNFIFFPVFVALGGGIGTFMFANQTSGFYISRSAWVMIPMSMSLITNAILNSLGSEVRAMKHYLAGAVVMFACVWFLPQYVGIGSLIIGVGACMAIASVLNLHLISKLIKRQVLTKTIMQLIAFSLVSLPAVLFASFTFGILIHMFNLFVALVVAGGISIFVVLFLCNTFYLVRFQTMFIKRT
jgi:stage V sporulation protein B